MSRIVSFPAEVNELSARLVATGVVSMGLAFMITGSGWVLAPLVYGFAARVLSGPRFSPLGLLVTRAITPAFDNSHKMVPGAPKRFAQGIGLAFTSTAAALFVAGQAGAAQLVVAALVGAASLEAFAGVCLGCIIYNRIWGCEDCFDITDRLATLSEARSTQQNATR